MASLDSILDEELEKLNQIKLVTTLLQARYSVQAELEDLSKTLMEIEQLQKDTSEEYEETKNLILESHSLIPLVVEVQEDWDDFNGNSEVQACLEIIKQQKKKPEESSRAQTGTKEDEQNQNQSRPSIKTENSCQKPTGIFIPLLSNEEFETIPKYIIGRNTLPVLNSFVSILNEILEEKYSFLAEGRLKAKKKNKIDKFLHYKAQESVVKENPKGNDVYFFVEEDYKNFTQNKLDKIKLTFLTALRHVKRIEFIRISKDMYYAVEKR